MSNLIGILTTGSAALGATAALWQASLAARQYLAAREEVRRLTQDKERQALQSNDIRQLGSYLYDNIGDTRIANYIGNAEVRARVSRALDGVLSFLGTEDTEITAQETEMAAQEANEPDVIRALEESQPYISSPPGEMARALDEITFGEV